MAGSSHDVYRPLALGLADFLKKRRSLSTVRLVPVARSALERRLESMGLAHQAQRHNAGGVPRSVRDQPHEGVDSLAAWLHGYVWGLETGQIVDGPCDWDWVGMQAPAGFDERLSGYPIKKSSKHKP